MGIFLEWTLNLKSCPTANYFAASSILYWLPYWYLIFHRLDITVYILYCYMHVHVVHVLLQNDDRQRVHITMAGDKIGIKATLYIA